MTYKVTDADGVIIHVSMHKIDCDDCVRYTSGLGLRVSKANPPEFSRHYRSCLREYDAGWERGTEVENRHIERPTGKSYAYRCGWSDGLMNRSQEYLAWNL